jgi:hypothetical protein
VHTACDAGSMLMHADNGVLDGPDNSIVSSGILGSSMMRPQTPARRHLRSGYNKWCTGQMPRQITPGCSRICNKCQGLVVESNHRSDFGRYR